MTVTEPRPEIGATVSANGIATNYLEAGLKAGSGPPLVFVHGSGPGVTAYANWRLTLPSLGKHFGCYAPDMVGFGFTERPEGIRYDVQTWADQVLGLLDALGLERASLVGNSFGGAIALRLAARHPDRVDQMVLMGSVGVPFPITDGLDAVWGYQPSPANMRAVMDYFAYSRELVTDELAEVRYRASIQPGFQESFSAMFPAPRQRWVDAMATNNGEGRVGAGSIAAPVFDGSGRARAAISIVAAMPVIDRSREHYSRLAVAAGQRLSRMASWG